MPRYQKSAWSGKRLWVGIDIHRKYWHVTILNDESEKLFDSSIPGRWPLLRQRLERYREALSIQVAYEASFSGFWLYDHLTSHGYPTTVTPPNKIPSAGGDRVKTDRVDSYRLADYLRAGILRAIDVPTPEERAHREVSRRRRKFIEDRVRAQNRIKAFLRFNGLEISQESTGRWSRAFVENLWKVRLKDRYQLESYHHLLEQFDGISRLVNEQTALLRDLSRSERYADRVELLKSIPGVGWLTAIELILELRDMRRFKRAECLSAYVGLTPSQHSSGERVRLGRITRQGLPNVRSLLVEASWTLIKKDPALAEKYASIKHRSGSKRAIVAIARRLILRMRRLLLDGVPYQLGVIQ